VRRLKSGATDRGIERRRFVLGDLVRETMASLGPQLRKHDFEVEIEVAQEVAMDSYPGALAHIFDPFFTTRRDAGNSGLGMHIVSSLVSGTLGGSIAVESTPGNGTLCRLILPLQP